jgi:hypothetical protein
MNVSSSAAVSKCKKMLMSGSGSLAELKLQRSRLSNTTSFNMMTDTTTEAVDTAADATKKGVVAGDEAVIEAKTVVDRAFDNAVVDATAMVTSEKVRDAKSVVDRAFDNATKSATTLAKAAGEKFDKAFGEAKKKPAATSPESEAKLLTEAGKAEEARTAGETAEETANK